MKNIIASSLILLALFSARESAALSQEFSPAILGMIKKMIIYEKSLCDYERKYEISKNDVRAIWMYAHARSPNLISFEKDFKGINIPEELQNALTSSYLDPESYFDLCIKNFARLFREFNGDRLCAWSAANAGEREVWQMLSRHGKNNWFKNMPKETKIFVSAVQLYYKFLAQYENWIEKDAEGLEVYNVKANDTIGGIAEKLGVTEFELRAYNISIGEYGIETGEILAYGAKPSMRLAKKYEHFSPQKLVHEVKIGDTFEIISLAYAVPEQSIRIANPFASDEPYVGQKIVIPQ